MKQPKKFREKVSKKCKKNAEKEHFQGFIRTFFAGDQYF